MDEDDLRSALTVLADSGPETGNALAQADRRVLRIRSTRRRVGLLGVAAAVIVVAGAPGIATLSRPTSTGPPAAASGSTFRDAPGAIGTVPGQSVGVNGRTTSRSDAAARPLLGYDWTAPGGGPELPVTVPIPADNTVRQMKFYPALDYGTITYSAPGGRLPSVSVTFGEPAAFVESTGAARSYAPSNAAPSNATPSSRTPTTAQRRSITTASGKSLLVEINSPSAVLVRSLTAGIAVAPTPVDLGIHLSQLPAGAYIGGARTDPDKPLSLATVEVVGSPDQGGGGWTLILRTASGLPAPVGSALVRALDGHPVTVYVGPDTTSWILLGDGRAVLLNGYPLSGTMLRDALAFPQSTLLPLLAGSTPSR